MKTKKHWYDYLWIAELIYFSLGFFNILFAWVGLCMFFIPLVLALAGWFRKNTGTSFIMITRSEFTAGLHRYVRFHKLYSKIAGSEFERGLQNRLCQVALTDRLATRTVRKAASKG